MRLLFTAFVLFLSASAVFAERRVALIFGADRYETLRPLKNAVRDARAIEDALLALNFEVFTETNRNLRRMRRALEDFEEDAAGADVAFVFFAGHGVEFDGENRLLPTDADPASLESLQQTSLTLNELQAVAARVAKTALIVLDACRDDPFGVVSDPTGRGAMLDEPVLAAATPGLGRTGQADNTLFAFAAAPGETASDGVGENSPFTAALTKYLSTEGLEIRSVLTLVQQEVYDRSRGQQLPYVESGLPNLFFASAASGDLPERERLLLAMAEIDAVTRRDVERVAADTGAPLAPLYAALVSSDLTALSRAQRSSKLREAATAFNKVREELQLLRSGDERVTALRQAAEEQLSLGAFKAARAKLTEAANIDATSRETLISNLAERTLSEAASHYLNAGAARAELEYPTALADYAKALNLFAEVGDSFFSPDIRLQHLNALSALGRINITIGDLTAAFDAFDTQRIVAQAAADQFPEDVNLQLELASAQDNLGDVVFEQGKIAAALKFYSVGRDVRERLVAKSPDGADYSFALSNSYERMGRIHHRQGDLSAAEAQYTQKHRISAFMIGKEPEGYRWERDLSVADELLGDIARERGDLDLALKYYQSSLNRMVPIRDANPDTLELQRFTSIALDRIGTIYVARGELQAAMQMFEEARALREALVAADPENTDWRYVLGISQEKLGDTLTRLGDTAAAAKAYEAKHAIVSSLSESDPTNIRWARDLSVADERLGQLARQRGDLTEALGHYRNSLNRMTPIRDASPTDMELNRFLSFTQDQIANVLMDQGETEKALNTYRHSLVLREKLVARDPQNQDWRFILGVSHELIGNAHMRIDQPEDAVQAYTQELAAMTALIKQDPDNLRWWRAVAISDEKLGNAYSSAGNLDAALLHYTASLRRMSKARDDNPDLLWLQRFTAVTLRAIGQTHLDAGDQRASLAAFEESLQLSTKLMAQETGNSRWLRDVLLAAKGVAAAGGNLANYSDTIQQAAKYLEALSALEPSDAEILEEIVRK